MTKPSGKKLIIYTSGDPGSQAIMQLMVDKGVPFERRDIRRCDPVDGWRNLKFLHRCGLDTVPQLFEDGERLIGDFDAARLHLVQLPDAMPAQIGA